MGPILGLEATQWEAGRDSAASRSHRQASDDLGFALVRQLRREIRMLRDQVKTQNSGQPPGLVCQTRGSAAGPCLQLWVLVVLEAFHGQLDGGAIERFARRGEREHRADLDDVRSVDCHDERRDGFETRLADGRVVSE